jgi:hypothetical protein
VPHEKVKAPRALGFRRGGPGYRIFRCVIAVRVRTFGWRRNRKSNSNTQRLSETSERGSPETRDLHTTCQHTPTGGTACPLLVSCFLIRFPRASSEGVSSCHRQRMNCFHRWLAQGWVTPARAAVPLPNSGHKFGLAQRLEASAEGPRVSRHEPILPLDRLAGVFLVPL